MRAEFKIPRFLRQRISDEQGQQHADPGPENDALHGDPHRYHKLRLVQYVLIGAERKIDGPQLHDPCRRRAFGAEGNRQNMNDGKKAEQPQTDQKSVIEAKKKFAAE